MHVTKLKPCVSSAIAALAQLHKSGFVTDLRFPSYVLQERNPKDKTYTEIIFRDPSDRPVRHLAEIEGKEIMRGVAIITQNSLATHAFTFIVYGPTGQTGGGTMPMHISRTWFAFKTEPIEHWAYQKNAPDIWTEEVGIKE